MHARTSSPPRAAALLLSLAAVFGCAEQTITPPPPVPATSLCGYPRACYVRGCDDCTGGPRKCRRVLGGCGADMGALASCLEPPRPGDPAVACPPSVDGGEALFCALPEAVCVARGPRCDGSCVRAAESCATGTPVPAQRSERGDGGGGTFCPYTDDVCCPVARDLGAADQAAPSDGPMPDAARRSD